MVKTAPHKNKYFCGDPAPRMTENTTDRVSTRRYDHPGTCRPRDASRGPRCRATPPLEGNLAMYCCGLSSPLRRGRHIAPRENDNFHGGQAGRVVNTSNELPVTSPHCHHVVKPQPTKVCHHVCGGTKTNVFLCG